MLKPIRIEDAIKLNSILFIDVRSPAEFQEATIPGAINIPILDDEERARVGTVYRRETQDKAITIGLDYASSKLTRIYEEIKDYSYKYDHIVIFCWRGGMRSKSVCSFLNMMNVPRVYQLVGGYKAYRKYVANYLESTIEKFKFIMVHGLTGVGKTHILDLLRKSGQPVLDLERLAQNSGSVFGDIVFGGSPPSQKSFESRIFDTLHAIQGDYVFVESESKRIGGVHVPEFLYNRMINGYHILIETSLQNRVEIILHDYVYHLEQDNTKIKDAIHHLSKRLGNETVATLIEKVEKKEYTYVIKYLIEYYYDPLYKYSIEKYRPYDLVLEYVNKEDIIPMLENFAKSI